MCVRLKPMMTATIYLILQWLHYRNVFHCNNHISLTFNAVIVHRGWLTEPIFAEKAAKISTLEWVYERCLTDTIATKQLQLDAWQRLVGRQQLLDAQLTLLLQQFILCLRYTHVNIKENIILNITDVYKSFTSCKWINEWLRIVRNKQGPVSRSISYKHLYKG